MDQIFKNTKRENFILGLASSPDLDEKKSLSPNIKCQDFKSCLVTRKESGNYDTNAQISIDFHVNFQITHLQSVA